MTPHSDAWLDKLIGIWIDEDIGDGDHTTLSIIKPEAAGTLKLLVKQSGIIAGVRIAGKIFNKFDPSLKLDVLIRDGSPIEPGDIVFSVSGKVRSLLQVERIVLNVLQRMSGVATQTHGYVRRLAGLNAIVLDTRKTTSGMRMLEKEAVKIGGGQNHRFGLYDMILIKDNHIDFAGGIEKALSRTRQYLRDKNKDLKIEVEARSLKDVAEILRIGGVDRILLDNFSIELVREAIKLIGKTCETEASGGITLDNVREYADCGVDYISVGALTHQIKSLDLSLKASF
jgi:nicotinate-nucleotide pyrophosphorylase (carboxylating)